VESRLAPLAQAASVAMPGYKHSPAILSGLAIAPLQARFCRRGTISGRREGSERAKKSAALESGARRQRTTTAAPSLLDGKTQRETRDREIDENMAAGVSINALLFYLPA